MDVMRGLAMFIIFIAHIPGNPWTGYIPARFGPSDATEWFVFCSGFASAIAFGGVFLRAGWGLGIARVSHRVWQIYWAQIGMFLATAGVCVLGTWALDTRDYVGQLNLYPFFNAPQEGLIGLFTLTYVPNLFDILPMYMVALLLIPVMVGLYRLNPLVGLAAPVALWAANRAVGFDLPAEWWSDRAWFFNPFAWQLIFFTGFAIARGWITLPPPSRLWTWIAAAYLIVMVPICYGPIFNNVPFFDAIGLAILPTFAKTDFGLARYLHFLAIAYVLRAALYGREEVLYARWIAPIRKVGQQALAVFITSIVLSRVGAMAFDVWERDALTALLVNGVGFAVLIGVAYGVGWIKSEPWRRQPSTPATGAPATGAAASGAAASGAPETGGQGATADGRRVSPAE
ncbi:MAG: OpgC domain-containing protein [Rhodovibrio sp.]|nr:OpgC domain-containing protein [Rhodovibrio sp.]